MGRELRLEGRLPLVQLVPVEKTERDGTVSDNVENADSIALLYVQ